MAGRAIAFRFKTGDFSWLVDYNRLVISTEKSVDTAAIAAKVVEKLPHTPLTAIGNNFRFRSSLSQWKGRLPRLDDFGFDKLNGHGDVQSVSWKGSISRADGVMVNTEVIVEPAQSLSPTVSVNVNCHREADDVDSVIAAANKFEEDRKSITAFLETLLREKVEQ